MAGQAVDPRLTPLNPDDPWSYEFPEETVRWVAAAHSFMHGGDRVEDVNDEDIKAAKVILHNLWRYLSGVDHVGQMVESILALDLPETPDDLLPELDTPPANGVFVDWEEDREDQAKSRMVARFVVDADPEVEPSIEAEGNAMGETVDPDDDLDNGLT